MKYTIAFMLLINSLQLMSQMPLTVKVVDKDKNGISKATIEVEEINITELTDDDGKYIFRSVPIGKIHLRISKTGFKTEVVSDRQVGYEAKNNYVTIELKTIDIHSKNIKDTVQFTNINTGNNHGVIGNGNTINHIEIKEQQRKLGDLDKIKILELINEVIDSKKQDKNICIQISSINDSEAFHLAKEIEGFLQERKMNVSGGIGSFQTAPPIEGVQIKFEQQTGNCLEILVGYKKIN